jgi:leucyl/phenylalanyl-tRNA---protein transferase
MRIPALLDPGSRTAFPDPELALRDPDGLLAIGGDLAPARLLDAYGRGIFPWYSRGQPILWWSPDPRLVFRTGEIHLSRRFRRGLRGSNWRVVADHDFAAVIDACASVPRPGQPGTWITKAMRDAYLELHRLGHAHSIEVRDGGALAGGLYGVAIGRMFFGESMASLRPGGSKVALAALAMRLREWGWPLVDAQVENPHLLALGAERWPRNRFLSATAVLVALPQPPGDWRARFGTLPATALSDRPPERAAE